MYKLWTPAEDAYLCANYSDLGALCCAEILRDRSIDAVRQRARYLKLKINKTKDYERRSKTWNCHPRTFDPSQFLEIKTLEAAYVHGLLWADGSSTIPRLGRKAYKILLFSTNPDAFHFSKVLSKTGNWKIRTGKARKNGWSVPITFAADSRPFWELMTSTGFVPGRSGFPEKLLDSLPSEKLRAAWLLGFFDGDGCFSIGKNGKCRGAHFAASRLFNWTYLCSWMKKIGIETKLSVSSSGSFCRFNKNEAKMLGLYIYDGNQFGLPRKKQRWQTLT